MADAAWHSRNDMNQASVNVFYLRPAILKTLEVANYIPLFSLNPQDLFDDVGEEPFAPLSLSHIAEDHIPPS